MMFEEIVRHHSPAALSVIVLAWLALGVGYSMLLEFHYRRRGINRWKPRPLGLGALP